MHDYVMVLIVPARPAKGVDNDADADADTETETHTASRSADADDKYKSIE